MDNASWRVLAASVRKLDRSPRGGRFTFTDADIVLTFLWAVLHRRPTSWACRRDAWPMWRRGRLPSPSRMSRRLRTTSVQALLAAAEAENLVSASGALVLALDGKALRVASHSGDRTATFGAWGLRGYKLHAICDLAGSIVSWRLTPMHCHEAVMAKRMMRDMELNGYVLADSNYDSVKLYELCACKGGQLVVPRKDCRVGRGVRRSGTHPDRRRAIDMLEQSMTGFGQRLLSLRRVIERVFARLEMTHHLGLIPPHVRGIERVSRWIQAIIILDRHTQAMKR